MYGVTNDPPAPPEGDIDEMGPAEKPNISENNQPQSDSKEYYDKPDIQPQQLEDIVEQDTQSDSGNQSNEIKSVDTPTYDDNSSVPTNPVTTEDPLNTPHDAMKPEKNDSKYSLMITILSIVTALIWIGVAGIYYSNNQLVAEKEAMQEALPTPIPVQPSDEIQVSNGNIVRTSSESGEQTVLVDKELFEGTGITGFLNVYVSPDETKMCFYSLSPAPLPAMYIASVDGSGVTEINQNSSGCIWSEDSSQIAFLNNTTDENASVNVLLYNVQTQQVTNLTDNDIQVGFVRKYSVPVWNDDTLLSARFVQTDVSGAEQEGVSEIDLTTNEVVTNLVDDNSSEATDSGSLEINISITPTKSPTITQKPTPTV